MYTFDLLIQIFPARIFMPVSQFSVRVNFVKQWPTTVGITYCRRLYFIRIHRTPKRIRNGLCVVKCLFWGWMGVERRNCQNISGRRQLTNRKLSKITLRSDKFVNNRRQYIQYTAVRRARSLRKYLYKNTIFIWTIGFFSSLFPGYRALGILYGQNSYSVSIPSATRHLEKTDILQYIITTMLLCWRWVLFFFFFFLLRKRKSKS